MTAQLQQWHELAAEMRPHLPSIDQHRPDGEVACVILATLTGLGVISEDAWQKAVAAVRDRIEYERTHRHGRKLPGVAS